MLNNLAINTQTFIGKILKIDRVINCRIFGTENRNFQHYVILPAKIHFTSQ